MRHGEMACGYAPDAPAVSPHSLPNLLCSRHGTRGVLRPPPVLISAYVLLACVFWLLWSAWVLDVEYFDSFDVLMNTDYLLGRYGSYLDHMAPMLSVVMVPARLAGIALGLDPMDLRPCHLTMALLHSLYLLGVFWLLSIRHGFCWPVLAAFCAAVLNFVFFSYGAFMNIDIFPGIIFVAMIFLSDKLRGRMCARVWVPLVVFGALAALLKQTFGLFWLVLIVAHAVPLFKPSERTAAALKHMALLVCGSAASFAIYYLFMCFVLKDSLIDGHFLVRPAVQALEYSRSDIENSAATQHWLYLANFSFYGFLTSLLVLPGIVMSLKCGDRLQRSLAVSWIVAFLFMHVILRREVRYIAFMAPLSAFMLVPVLEWIMGKPRILAFCIIVLTADLLNASWEALRIVDPFYRESQLKRFLSPLRVVEPGTPCVFNDYLCFIPPRRSPFIGDYYHRKFHFSPYHVKHFFREDLYYMWNPARGNALHDSLSYGSGDCLIYANFFPMEIEGNFDADTYVLIFARVERVPYDASELVVGIEAGKKGFEDVRLGKVIDRYIYPVLYDPHSEKLFPVFQEGGNRFRLGDDVACLRPYSPLLTDAGAALLGYEIIRLVQIDSRGGTVCRLCAPNAIHLEY
ncbi:MAG: hypothetical protein JW808_03070 [Victivallales bacterium]|nr:hypothetical protein [Victivallales bacterium]